MSDSQGEVLDLDEILTELGHGSYQRKNYAFLFIPMIFTAFNTISYVFTAGIPDYRCLVPECDDSITKPEYKPNWLSNAVPYKGVNPSRCQKYHPISNKTGQTVEETCPRELFNQSWVEKCDKLVFASETTTIANDFDIFCDSNIWMLTLAGTIHNVGEFFCLPLSGYFSDRYGRRNVLIVGLVLSAIIGLVRSFSTNYIWFMTLEFLDPFFGSGAYASTFILGMELVDPSERVLGCAIICSAYAVGEAIVGALAWLTTSWRTLLRIIYSPLLFMLAYFWLIPESVRWLMSKRKYEEVEKILKNVATMNKKELSKNSLASLEAHKNGTANIVNDQKKETNDYPLLDVFKNYHIFLRIVNCSFCWITCSFVFYGLSLNSVSIAGNIYLNFIAVSLIEIPGYFISYLVLDRIGRRATLCGSLVIAGISCIGFMFVPEEKEWISLILFLLGKCGITVSFTSVYVFTTELFPTPVRHSIMGICSMFGRTGSMLAPQTPLAAEIWEPLPLLLFGVMSFASGLLVLLLPETLNIKLPDTLEEARNIGKEKPTKESVAKYTQKTSI